MNDRPTISEIRKLIAGRRKNLDRMVWLGFGLIGLNLSNFSFVIYRMFTVGVTPTRVINLAVVLLVLAYSFLIWRRAKAIRQNGIKEITGATRMLDETEKIIKDTLTQLRTNN